MSFVKKIFKAIANIFTGGGQSEPVPVVEPPPAPAPAPPPAPPAPVEPPPAVVEPTPPPKVEELPPPVMEDPNAAAQKEYERRLEELKTQRMKDVSSMKARMAAGGVASESPGWMQGLETIYSSYDDKLKQLGADPYFSKISKSSSPWV